MAKNIKDINICFIANENVLKHTLTCAKSLLLTKKTDSKYTVNVVVDDIDQGEQELQDLKALTTNNFKVNIVHWSSKNYPNYKVRYQNAKKTAFIKFDLPNIFPDVDKLLYIDQDMIILDDLTPIFDEDMNDLYIRATEHIPEECWNIVETGYLERVFNSGFMLLNLDLFRKNNMTEKLFDIRSNHPFVSQYWLMDQLAFNVGCNGKIQPVNPYFNHIFRPVGVKKKREISIEYYNEFYKTDFASYNDLFDRVASVHVASQDKPWNENCQMHFAWLC